jgi:hypothetical protein
MPRHEPVEESIYGAEGTRQKCTGEAWSPPKLRPMRTCPTLFIASENPFSHKCCAVGVPQFPKKHEKLAVIVGGTSVVGAIAYERVRQ